MPYTSTNMSLKVWDDLGDLFNHDELEDNWLAVDTHDHTTGKGLKIPAGGLADNAVTTTILADDAVTGAKVADATILDTHLNSPSNLAWRSVYSVTGYLNGSAASGNYICDNAGLLRAAGTSSAAAFPVFRPDIVGYAVPNKTTYMRIVTHISTGTVLVGGTSITPTLFALSSLGGTGAGWTPTVTTPSYTSGGGISLPAINTNATVIGGSPWSMFSMASTFYALGIASSATLAASSTISVTMFLELCYT